MRLRAYKFRIYPNSTQASGIRKACGCRRYIYNWGLALKQQAYQSGIKVSFYDLANKIPELKIQFPWLKTDANSQSIQSALKDLDVAFNRFFKKTSAYPTFKKRGKSKESFHIPQHFKINVSDGALMLPKLGSIKAVFHREMFGTAKSITVSMSKSRKFFASILMEQDIQDQELKPINPDLTIGIDMGIKTFAVCSNGLKFENPKSLRKSMSRIKFLSRQHSKKTKGGKNRNRARIILARQHEKVSNQRLDFLHKTSNSIANESQVSAICIEDLNVKGMMKNHCLAGAIGDCSWSEFFRQLKYKCQWRGIRIIEIGRFEPSSKLCPCGFKNDALTLADRSWVCPKCGQTHDRDELASQNIKRFGVAKATLTAGGTPVENLGSCLVGTQKRRTKKPRGL